MKLSQIAGVLGADVSGLDLSNLGDAGFAELQSALDTHLVLRLRGQSLDRFAMAALGERFGHPFLHPLVDNGYDDCKAVLELLREPQDKAMFGGESWHADISWLKPAGYTSILHALEIPPVGGDTAFASTVRAFETLSPKLQDVLQRLEANHSYYWYERREEPAYCATHPVVRKHPVTGAEGLYVTRMFTNRFFGMSEAESAGLLGYLFEHQEKAEFTCRFSWAVGDVLIWDNRFTLHYPINDFSGHRRRMIRTSSMEQA